MNDSKPKVLILLDRLVIGGQAVDVIPLCYYLQSSFDVHIAYGKKKKEDTEAHFLLEHYPLEKVYPLKFLKKTFNPVTNLMAYLELKKLIHSIQPTIVHTNAVKCGVLGRFAAFKLQSPVIIHTFHGHFFHSYFNRFFSKTIVAIERKMAAISNIIVATSNAQAQDLTHNYKIADPQKVKVITLGIDESFLQKQLSNQQCQPFVSQFPIHENTLTIGIIARIVKVKNFHLFVEVVKKVIVSTNKNVQFFVIGDGFLKLHVQELLTNARISWCNQQNFSPNAHVVFTSWMPYISIALEALDIVILTSHNEGTGLSLVESQLFGKPVVATAVGGVPDTVLNGKTGFLVPNNNAEAFAEKLVQLINDDTLRLSMGQAAKSFAKEKFSKQVEVAQFSDLYNASIQALQ